MTRGPWRPPWERLLGAPEDDAPLTGHPGNGGQ